MMMSMWSTCASVLVRMPCTVDQSGLVWFLAVLFSLDMVDNVIFQFYT